MPDLSHSPETPSDAKFNAKFNRSRLDASSWFKTLRSHLLTRWILLAIGVLFAASTARHLLLMSTGFDLGIYDQVAYLLSRGKAPISSYLGFHHMGNHAASSFYLLAHPQEPPQQAVSEPCQTLCKPPREVLLTGSQGWQGLQQL